MRYVFTFASNIKKVAKDLCESHSSDAYQLKVQLTHFLGFSQMKFTRIQLKFISYRFASRLWWIKVMKIECKFDGATLSAHLMIMKLNANKIFITLMWQERKVIGRNGNFYGSNYESHGEEYEEEDGIYCRVKRHLYHSTLAIIVNINLNWA